MSVTCDAKRDNFGGYRTLCYCESVSVKSASGRSYCEDGRSVWSWRWKMALCVMNVSTVALLS